MVDIGRAIKTAAARAWSLPGRRGDGAAWAEECIEVLAVHAPRVEAGAVDALGLVQRQLLHGERLIHAFLGRTPGDSQAIDHYHAGIAAGFYEQDPTAEPPSFEPVAGSNWRSDQLRRLRQLGFEHGAAARGPARTHLQGRQKRDNGR